MLLKIFQLFAKLTPVLFIGFIAWFSYSQWLNQFPSKVTLANSVEAKDVKISSKVSGRISKIFIKEGEKVIKGQKLLELEGDEIIAQLNQAKAAYSKAKSDLTDLVMGARAQEIAQATAEKLKTEALLEQAKSKHQNSLTDFNRMKELFKEGAISKQKLDEYEVQNIVAEKDVKKYEEENIKAKENEDLVKEGPRKDQVKALEAQVSYYSARVDEFKKYADELTIHSPLNGEVSSFDLKIGEVIKPLQTLTTITDLKDIYVRVYIPGILLGKIKPRQKVKLSADSYPEELFNGYISYIGAQAEYTPRNIQTPEERTKLVYPVKVQIYNKENKLRDGMYVTLKL